MNKFTNLMERSKAIHRFMQLERMSQDDIYNLFYTCYTEYESVFTDRLRHGQHISKIIREYKQLPEFGALKASQLCRTIFTSKTMAYWFAYAFYLAIEKQVSRGKTSIAELQLSLAFLSLIPSAQIMEEILYEQKRINKNAEPAGRPVRETERTPAEVTV